MKKLLILIVSGFVEVGVLQVKATFHHFIASKMSGFVLITFWSKSAILQVYP